MGDYEEIVAIRGDGTVDGIIDYLNFLESRINHKLKFGDDGTILGESTDDDTGRFLNYSLFEVPEWLLMGRDIEDWLAYALSLEMTNFYINSKERIEKLGDRQAWLKGLNSGVIEEIIEANESDCLSLIRNKKREIISFVRSLEEISGKAGGKPVGELFEDRIGGAALRIKEEKQTEMRDVAQRRAKAESLIDEMLNDTIQHFKENRLHWQRDADELTLLANENENRYNIRYMKAFFEMAKDSDVLFRLSNSETADDNCTKRSAIPSEVKREVWRRDQGQCSVCGSTRNLEYDHIIPISKGGSNTVRNIQLLCEQCNRVKSSKIV